MMPPIEIARRANTERAFAMAKKLIWSKYDRSSIKEEDEILASPELTGYREIDTFIILQQVLPRNLKYRVVDSVYIAHKEVSRHTDNFTSRPDEEITVLWTLSNRNGYELEYDGDRYPLETGAVTLFDHTTVHSVPPKDVKRAHFSYHLAIALLVDKDELSSCMTNFKTLTLS